MHWTKSRLSGKIMRKFQRNLLTMNQTAVLSVIFFLNHIATVGLSLLEDIVLTKYLTIFEFCRIIVVENAFLKIVLPIMLISRSKSKLPALWLKDSNSVKIFYFSMSNIKPRNDMVIVLENEYFSYDSFRFNYLLSKPIKIVEDEEKNSHDNIILVKRGPNQRMSRFIYVWKKSNLLCQKRKWFNLVSFSSERLICILFYREAVVNNGNKT